MRPARLMKQRDNAFPEALIDQAYRLAAHEQVPKAELIAGATPVWLVVTTAPNQERIAAAHMFARRFMICLPEVEVNDRGQKRVEFMFPGHLFVFVWDAAEHWDRIKACPGVSGILGELTDADMRAVQRTENERYPLLGSVKIGKKKRWRRKPREQMDEYSEEIISVRMRSALTDIRENLDSEARNSLLVRALGLPAVPARE